MLTGWLELILLSIPLFLASFFIRPMPGGWYSRLFRVWCRTFTHALGVDLRLHQKNEAPLPERFILIANHPSVFEDIGIPALFDVDCLAKQEVAGWWIVGRISATAGTLFVQRESPESRQQASDSIERRLASGRNVGLYPEGGIKGKRIHSEFRYGVFDISLKTGTPIVPVFIHYEAQDDFHWKDELLVEKILQIMFAENKRANYYLYDAFNPIDFATKEEFAQHVHRQYLKWQGRYLD